MLNKCKRFKEALSWLHRDKTLESDATFTAVEVCMQILAAANDTPTEQQICEMSNRLDHLRQLLDREEKQEAPTTYDETVKAAVELLETSTVPQNLYDTMHSLMSELRSDDALDNDLLGRVINAVEGTVYALFYGSRLDRSVVLDCAAGLLHGIINKLQIRRRLDGGMVDAKAVTQAKGFAKQLREWSQEKKDLFGRLLLASSALEAVDDNHDMALQFLVSHTSRLKVVPAEFPTLCNLLRFMAITLAKTHRYTRAVQAASLMIRIMAAKPTRSRKCLDYVRESCYTFLAVWNSLARAGYRMKPSFLPVLMQVEDEWKGILVEERNHDIRELTSYADELGPQMQGFVHWILRSYNLAERVWQAEALKHNCPILYMALARICHAKGVQPSFTHVLASMGDDAVVRRHLGASVKAMERQGGSPCIVPPRLQSNSEKETIEQEICKLLKELTKEISD